MKTLHKAFSLVLCLVLVLQFTPRAQATAYDAHPKLVIIMVIDQFRGDYIERDQNEFKTPNGFNLFLKHGAYFLNCYYDYANTKTAPGHTTIGTGAYTDGHGIGSNDWWDLKRSPDRPVSSVEDERYRVVGTFDDIQPIPGAPPIVRIGASPLNERASTIGDELRLATEGQSKLYGISLKDRAAILPPGHTANGAFWVDKSNGRFETSTYYMQQLPAWATAFNKSGRAEQAMQEANVPGTTSFYELVGRTPAANRYELDFAKALIQGEKLGQGKVTDMLTVSLSANDIIGHQMGPDSDSEHQMVLSLDRDLNGFFTWVDKNVPGGLSNVVIALTADHGVGPVPSQAARLGMPSATINLEKVDDYLNAALNKKYSPGRKVEYMLPEQELPYLALDWRAFKKAGVSEADAENAVAAAMPDAIASLNAAPKSSHGEQPSLAAPTLANPYKTGPTSETRLAPTPSIAFIRTRLQLAAGDVPPTELGRILAHSYTPNGGWYVMVVPDAYQMEQLDSIQTTHFSPWSYDRHVPLGFYGADFIPGIYRQPVAPVDIAATLASLLEVNRPSACVGHVLTEALRPIRHTERSSAQ
ncbi:MAG: alkaline phosphatase family protein [Acidobacteriaceae bacterium]